MKFDTPATINPIDQLKVVGQPHYRIDGPLKVTGTARYAYENNLPGQTYGYIVGATIAKGRIRSVDAAEARRAAGVIAIVTAENAGQLGKGDFNTAKLLAGPEVQHYHQAVALVVAETFEQARTAAQLVKVEYVPETGEFDLEGATGDARKPESGEPDSAVGDFDSAFAAAPVTLKATYHTPDQSHSMMEPHASVAAWDGDQLVIWTSSQMINWGTNDLAKTLGIARDKIHLTSHFVGGGFGGKLFLRTDAVLAALGARLAKRPVKVAMQRPLVANNTTHRPATIQRIRIGADKTGKITAIGHEGWSGDLPNGQPENAVQQTRFLYAGDHRMTATRLAVLDLPEGNAMRAPGEAPGLMALEIAMDEMAEKLGMDPVEFRIINDTQVVPDKPAPPKSDDPQAASPDAKKEDGPLPFSQRQLAECLRRGAEQFGWSKRNPRTGQTKDGRWLVGMGVAAGFRNNLTLDSGARVRLNAKGEIIVETDMTDIGTGSYTIIAQTAAEMMGVPIDQVIVRLGDSTYPVSSGSGGQFGANSSTAGVYAACVKLREAVTQKLGFNADDALFADNQVQSGNRALPLAEAAADGELSAEDSIEFGDLGKKIHQSTFGAHFVEVGVDTFTAEVRVRRMLAVCAAGRILNPITARSQVIGAMTMGIGGALMEELAVDKKRGFFVNHDLAGYEVPVHADIPHQDVVFLDEIDPTSSPMKAKGVGELGLCGVGAAVANAIYNATGVRVRNYPITLDKMLGQLPGV